MKQMTRNKAAGRKNKKKSMQWAAAVMALALTGMNASEMAAMIPMQVKAAETARPQSAVRYILLNFISFFFFFIIVVLFFLYV